MSDKEEKNKTRVWELLFPLTRHQVLVTEFVSAWLPYAVRRKPYAELIHAGRNLLGRSSV